MPKLGMSVVAPFHSILNNDIFFLALFNCLSELNIHLNSKSIFLMLYNKETEDRGLETWLSTYSILGSF